MVALWILCGVFLLLVLLLLSRIRLRLILDGGLTLRAGLGIVVLTLLPQKKKKTKKPPLRPFSQKRYAAFLEKERRRAEKKDEKKAKKSAEKKAEQKENPKPLGESIEAVLALVEEGISELSRLSRRVTTDVRALVISVSGEDAAEAAERYGAVSLAVTAFLTFLDRHTALVSRDGNPVTVQADFLSGRTTVLFDFSVRVPLYAVLVTVVRFLMAVKRDKDVSKPTQLPSEARNGKHQ